MTKFQVWTKRKTAQKDLRIKEKPITKHPDFEMYLHNNTQSTLKYFQKDKYQWDFAVVRQGFYDYAQKIKSTAKLDQKNTITPSFGKHDVVVAYNGLFCPKFKDGKTLNFF